MLAEQTALLELSVEIGMCQGVGLVSRFEDSPYSQQETRTTVVNQQHERNEFANNQNEFGRRS